MNKITCIGLLFFTIWSSAQNCNSNTTNVSSYTAKNTENLELVTGSIFAGEYVTVTNILEEKYTFTSTYLGSNDFITIRNASGSEVLAESVSPLTYTFQSADIPTGEIRVIIHLSDSCDGDSDTHTVNLQKVPTCYKPEDPRVNYLSNTRLDFYWSAPSTGPSPSDYDWEIGPAGFTPGTGSDVVNGSTGGLLEASSGENALVANTTYQVAIRSNCGSGDYSNWLITPNITTLSADPPPNDLCSGATLIIQETGKAVDGSDATSIPGSVLGGAETNEDAEICNAKSANARDDVWYRFLAQTTDINITLDPLFDGRLSLFSGDCNTLLLLDCSDDNGGLSPTTEAINFNNLTIGQTYYFRVYSQGFKATNPNFTYKLWSSQSITDDDVDGYSTGGGDCDDSESTVYPGAPEICDGLDNDCNGQTDEGLATVDYYPDSDGDGYGDASALATSVCSALQPDNTVTNNTDCDDTNAGINVPITYYVDADGDGYGSTTTEDLCETSAPVGYSDNNTDCDDGDINLNPDTVWYADSDGDGYGNNAVNLIQCEQPANYVLDNSDCDDTDVNLNPATVWYADSDGDGYGNSAVTLIQCEQPANYVLDNSDCDDGDVNLNPDTVWYADSDGDGYGNNAVTLIQCEQPANYVLDNSDCDDDDVNLNPDTVWYADSDGDGYGNNAVTLIQCEQPANYVLDNSDCDDGNVNLNPDTVWYADSDGDGYGNNAVTLIQCEQPANYILDNSDCDDGDVNLNPDTVWYADSDGDGYGDNAVTLIQCEQPANYVLDNTDCDDTDVNLNPDTVWYADSDGDGYGNNAVTLIQCEQPANYVLDNSDCDDGDVNLNPDTVWYADSDGDGYGNNAVTLMQCEQPANYVSDNSDCDDADVNLNPDTVWYADSDGDGYGDLNVTQLSCNQPSGYVSNSMDCNDSNFNINPDATEVCDGIDNDCDGQIDEGVKNTYYADNDGDGYGDASASILACSAPVGYVSNNTDCNDNESGSYPGNVEVCDGIDNDCDGQVDEGVKNTYYADTDGDGYGDAGNSILACSAPLGYVSDNTDCDDSEVESYPGNTEVCDGIDNDCDGQVDEGVTNTYYADTDGDGFGDASASILACSAPEGYVIDNTDCNDNEANAYPGNAEVCDGIDNDCDGQVDEGVKNTYYADSDGDGYGDFGNSQLSCSQPLGYVSNSLDCDDTDVNVNPAATEICDGIDNDCDGLIDGADDNITGQDTWYADNDNDGYGDFTNSFLSCNKPIGYVSNSLDCDDTDANINPNATEICDGIDNDCDGQIDDADNDITGQHTWYADSDNDGYGDFGNSQLSCSQPLGYVSNSLDCDDTDVNVNPAATEICDGIDNNCDGQVDEDVKNTYYADIDGDGYGDASASILACSAPEGYVSNNTDCNDNEADAYPGNAEVCDGIDNDCDGQVDEGVKNTYYADSDGDGYGDFGNSQLSCNQPPGYVSNSLDCNDADVNINPAATEICDGIDNDCDGLIDGADDSITGQDTWYADNDNDGYGDFTNSFLSCNKPIGYVSNSLDCDDTDANINPNATEICDGIDNDCDGQIDDADNDITGQFTWYADSDNDGYGDFGNSQLSCSQPLGYVSNSLDCNDTDVNVSPAATEICDGIDNNCDGQVDEDVKNTYYADIDGDGYGDASVSILACSAPEGYVSNNTDCNDNEADAYPGNTEVCDGIDNDCDGQVDEGVKNTYYADSDGDGYGNAGTSILACSAPNGYVSDNTDCNDNEADSYPGNTEVCDGIDNDCDGQIDEGVENTYYADTDGDGYGDAGSSILACSAPEGYVSNNTDCNDNEANAYPGNTEVCDGIDNDCDGQVDEGVKNTYYADTDGDGYGDAGASILACSAPSGYVSNNTDCNDNESASYPGNVEVCDGIDNDCDGQVDEGVKNTYYADSDGDGYGDMNNALEACSQPAGYVTDSTDCDDSDANINPGEVEIPNNGTDENCDGTDASLWYQDLDGDGFGNPNISQQSNTQPTGYVGNNTDCNDNEAASFPGNTEICDGIDNNCDGQVDEGVENTYYADNDGDGYGDAVSSILACSAPSGYVSDNTDCDDTEADAYPGNTEVCDGIDNDCDGQVDEGVENTYYADTDGDGYGDASASILACSAPAGYVSNNTDCNDNESASYPGNVEVCDGIDNDCDGQVDEGVKNTYYADTDGDGYGNIGTSILACSAPEGYVSNNSDCNDNESASYPGNVEVCDGIDNDCDGQVDEGVENTYYADTDGDGYGDAGSSILACSAPAGYVSDNTDCDDTEADAYSGNIEVCDGIDNDCDGQVDEGVKNTYYADTDGDGYGDSSSSILACSAPSGYVSNNTDCDDTEADAYPGNAEVCDGIDNDCDGQVDEGVKNIYYADTDGDGYGDVGNSISACSVPDGYVTDSTDCDDSDANINPGEVEIPNNGTDENCDGTDASIWYQDLDGDGFGNPNMSQQSNTQPTGYVGNNTDCNDNESASYPGNVEVCDGIDNDCDGQVDEGVENTYYADTDGDGYGDAGSSILACSAPSGYVSNNTDCNDDEANAYPGNTEVCDGIDNDCDGQVDEGVKNTYYADTDGDGYGDAGSSILACSAPSGYVIDNTDCNDNEANAYPGNAEVCDGIDNDCDGQVDEGVKNIYYADHDGDGYGDVGNTQEACSQPAGYVTDNTDCDDSDANINPGEVEIPNNGTDENCDGTDASIWYQDLDGDGFGNPNVSQQSNTQPTGYVGNNTDCNDNEANAYPGNAEVCDGIDNNCDGQVDEGVENTYYADTDGDGYGDAGSSILACSAPAGYVIDNTDCNDNEANAYPGNIEVCDGIDNDCDGQVDEGVKNTYYADSDGDGYGDASASILACSAPLGYVSNNTDCNDNESASYPGNAEVCDGIDNDCDGQVDEGVKNTYYADTDGDGYGDVGNAQEACSQPAGYVTDSTDCDDSDANINPGEVEIPNNGTDENCDGTDASIWYQDLDGDGFGNPNMSQQSNTQPTGYVGNNTDCNDNESASFPGNTEICDGIDNDCDGQVDEGVENTYYADADGDGYGDAGSSILACSAPNGYVIDNTDCNDNEANAYPGNVEVCDGIDNDCDGQVDEGVKNTYYADSDGDGYGDPSASILACSAPLGYVSNNTDCNDNESASYPGNAEVCDGIDNDCDGQVDEGVKNIYYADTDGDGYGDVGNSISACSVPDGYVTDSTDCDDSDANINPGEVEIPNNGTDENCDGTDASIWYQDLDGDGFGNPNISQQSNTQPTGYVGNNTDCNDNEVASFPGNTEICDGIDNNCDGQVDEGVKNTYYADTDGDGYGDVSNTQEACSQPAGYVTDSTDCNDSDITVHPGATELCDGKDNDCTDGIPTDEIDTDGDGILDCIDNCPDIANADQADSDGDNIGDLCEGLNSEEFSLKDIFIKPNPFNSTITIQMPSTFNNELFTITLFDIRERMVVNEQMLCRDGAIQISNLDVFNQGVYLLRIVSTNNKQFFKRLIKL
ncbi:MopE-related protein [Tamlana flava]|uniref:MopE-related protein n=1 Tax=Tamlana flava TaxID=3158572 RepID=UPI00351B94BC